MPDFKFQLDQLVKIDPAREGNRLKGRVVGRIEYLEGEHGYVVRTANFSSRGTVITHILHESDLVAVEEPSK